MPDQFVEKTSRGLGSRLGDSIKGVLFGVVLVIAGFPILWWNEGRAVQTYKSLEEGAGQVVSLKSESVDPAYQGKLIHISGHATTGETLRDPEFGVSAQALRLEREVEMYQWVERVETETKKKVGGGEETTKTYTYEHDWQSGVVDSSQFKIKEGHQNPRGMAYKSETWRPQRVTVGAFVLPGDLQDRIHGRESVPPAKSAAARAGPAKGKGKKGKAKAGKTQAAAYTLDGDRVYIGKDPAAPAVGDLRIGFYKTNPTDVTIVAAQTGDTLARFQTKAGDALAMLKPGTHTATAMFEMAHSENVFLTWILRVVGFLCLLFGLRMVLAPLAVAGDVLPFLGSLMRLGITFVAFSLALPLSLLTVAAAWLFYRPVLAGILIASGVAAVVLVKMLAAKRRPAAEASAAAPS